MFEDTKQARKEEKSFYEHVFISSAYVCSLISSSFWMDGFLSHSFENINSWDFLPILTVNFLHF